MPTYEILGTVAGTGSSQLLTFSNIPQTYKQLRIVFSTFNEQSRSELRLRINGDTSTNSWNVLMYAQGTTVDKYRNSYAGGGIVGYDMVPGTTTPSVLGVSIIDIFDYTSNSVNKTVLSNSILPSASNPISSMECSYWASQNAITSLSLFVSAGYNWSTNAKATLFGLG